MGADMRLDGVKVLVLEDSYLIAELIEDMLLQAGAIVVGTAKSVALALHVLATQAVDLACLGADVALAELIDESINHHGGTIEHDPLVLLALPVRCPHFSRKPQARPY
jgi:AmiR/NasT family two-component response regulator